MFVVAAMLIGTRVVPWVLERIARTGSRELFTLAVLAIALGIAFGSAALFGVSFALGAFFAGAVLSESELSQRAAEDTLPLQDAFAVLFFVSVGMLFDPSILVREPLAVLGVILVIVVGKSLAAFVIVLLFRYPVGTALIVSASLAQIGEFSFILAALGIALNLMPPEARDLVLAGALISITLNPFVFAGIPAIERWLRARPRLLALLERRSLHVATEKASTSSPTRNHAILIGHGRVGGTITPVLKQEALPYLVVERDRRRFEALQAQGVPVIFGDASVPGVLERAGIASARLLIVATPDSFIARRAVEIARSAQSRRRHRGAHTQSRGNVAPAGRAFRGHHHGRAGVGARNAPLHAAPLRRAAGASPVAGRGLAERRTRDAGGATVAGQVHRRHQRCLDNACREPTLRSAWPCASLRIARIGRSPGPSSAARRTTGRGMRTPS